MHWFIDLVLIAVLAYFTHKHFRLGLMHTVYNLGKFIAAVLSALIFGWPVGSILSDLVVEKAVTESVYQKISEYLGGGSDLSHFFENLPEGFLDLVNLFGVDAVALQEKYESAVGSEEVLREMAATIATPISEMFSAIVAYVLIFVIVYVVLSIVIKGLKKIKIPILSSFDKTLGLILGLTLGMLNVSMIATAVYSALEFIAAMNSDPAVMSIYNNSIVFKFIYNMRFFEFIRNIL